MYNIKIIIESREPESNQRLEEFYLDNKESTILRHAVSQ